MNLLGKLGRQTWFTVFISNLNAPPCTSHKGVKQPEEVQGMTVKIPQFVGPWGTIRTGDLICLRKKTKKKKVSPKLMSKWKEPYMVIKRFGPVNEIMTCFKVTKLHHFNLLKACHATETQRWIERASKLLMVGCQNTQGSSVCVFPTPG